MYHVLPDHFVVHHVYAKHEPLKGPSLFCSFSDAFQGTAVKTIDFLPPEEAKIKGIGHISQRTIHPLDTGQVGFAL